MRAWIDARTVTMGLASALTFSACLEIPPPPKAAAVPPPAPAADPAVIAAEEAQAAAYAYSPVGKRDPFQDPANNKKLVVIGPKDNPTPLTPLQQYEIDQLSLAFTNTATATPMAMVLDPHGRSHVVQIGDFIGKNWGKVSSIKREELQIMSTMADESGRVYPVFTPLRMKNTEEVANRDAYELSIRTNQ